MKPYVNLGCGKRYHPDWINIDLVPRGPNVIQQDLSQRIPLPDHSCEVVYHAAVLEHMRRQNALEFLRDCHRILKPGGVIRVGVPDLEELCRLYLVKLQATCDGDEAAAHDYDWIMLELYDQTVREETGGAMKDFLRQDPLPNEEFVYDRIGEEGRQLVEALRDPEKGQLLDPGDETEHFRVGLWRLLRSFLGSAGRSLLWLLLGAQGLQALDIGSFRLSGEVHHWMYDRYSLARMLVAAGFQDPVVQSAHTSQIPNWSSFHLDTLPDGRVIKPDLLFMEATRGDDG